MALLVTRSGQILQELGRQDFYSIGLGVWEGKGWLQGSCCLQLGSWVFPFTERREGFAADCGREDHLKCLWTFKWAYEVSSEFKTECINLEAFLKQVAFKAVEWMRSPREWIRNVTWEAVKEKAKYADLTVFLSLLSREGTYRQQGFVCFLLPVTTSLRKLTIHSLGNCLRWFYSMTLLQFVWKTKHELGWKGYLAFVGYNSPGTFGKKLVVMRICFCGKKEKSAFASKPCSH